MAEIASVSLDRPPGEIAGELGRSFTEHGFAVVRDHGVPADLVRRTEEALKAAVALPDAVKRRYHAEGLAGARGYTPFGLEHAKDAPVHDLKEFWHVGRDLPPGHRYQPVMPDNVWPDEVPDLRNASLALFTALEQAGLRICRALAIHLDLPKNFLQDALKDGNSVLRLLHYPPVPEDAEPGAIRAAPHEDINAITLLLGAQEAGLELQTRDGEWLPVSPPEGALVVNIGDMLQRLTAGRMRSTTHRVVNPAGEASRRSRYSMPFFLHFRPDFLIDPVFEGGEEPITAQDYLMQRLREIGLA
jgi:isopenicillin N synthase-like dioxygenase